MYLIKSIFAVANYNSSSCFLTFSFTCLWPIINSLNESLKFLMFQFRWHWRKHKHKVGIIYFSLQLWICYNVLTCSIMGRVWRVKLGTKQLNYFVLENKNSTYSRMYIARRDQIVNFLFGMHLLTCCSFG